LNYHPWPADGVADGDGGRFVELQQAGALHGDRAAAGRADMGGTITRANVPTIVVPPE